MFIAENRTAECLGIQHVWIVKNVEQKQKKFVANRKITRVRPFRFRFLFFSLSSSSKLQGSHVCTGQR